MISVEELRKLVHGEFLETTEKLIIKLALEGMTHAYVPTALASQTDLDILEARGFKVFKGGEYLTVSWKETTD